MKKVRLLALAGMLAIGAICSGAATITENFSTDPLQNGWQIFGDTNLFQWDSTNQNLMVTWNSTNENSYFYKPLGTALTKDDSFTVAFDLRLEDIAVTGYGQQIAVGLLNFFEATNASYSRALGNSPDLFEFDYFLDTGYGDSIDASLADMTVGFPNENDFYFAYANQHLAPGTVYHIVLAHAAGSTTISGQVFTNGVLYADLTHTYAGSINNFHLDTLSVSSYADDGFGDDVLAHGVVGNFTVTLSAPAASTTAIMENFFSDPLQHGWNVFGDTNLFHWDPTNQNLAVTWDSSQGNSYFYKTLGTTLTKTDAFTVDFDIQLNSLQWTNSLQIAIGFLKFADATNAAFSRPLGYSPNIFEFNYFPDDGLGEPNVAASMTDQTTSITNFPDFYFIFGVQPMNLGTTYHVQLSHQANESSLTGVVLTNGVVYSSMPQSYPGSVGDFQLDTVSISSYSGAGQDPGYAGSILAQGAVDNFVVSLPAPARNLIFGFNSGQPQVQFSSYTNWTYTLESSTNLVSWTTASISINGTGGVLTLSGTNAPSAQAFYRVRAVQQ